MKVTFEVDTIGDEFEYNSLLNAKNMALFSWNFSQYLRDQVKYQEKPDTIEKVQDTFWDMFKEEGLNESILH